LIFVTGCARSGTSLITKILKAHGCNLGDPVNALNENTGVREGVLKPYLRSIGADHLGQRKLPDTNNLVPIDGLREKVLKHFPPWDPVAYKDAKLTLVWPVFSAAFPEAKWVVVRRDRERIVDSCLRTDFMFSYNERQPWMDWVLEHEARFSDMAYKLDMIEVWTDAVVQEASNFAPVCTFLGLEFDLDATLTAVDAKKWHPSDAAAPVL